MGGPTHYKPLRDKVAFELGIAPSTDVNPMTAVAEGAAVFAESIDWSSQSRGRKSARGAISAGGSLDLSFNYIARTPDSRAKIVAKLGRAPTGIEFQIDSLDTGWSSGRVALKDGASIELSLTKPGDNTFKVFVFDSNGAPVTLGEDKIVIARTADRLRARGSPAPSDPRPCRALPRQWNVRPGSRQYWHPPTRTGQDGRLLREGCASACQTDRDIVVR